MLLNDYLCSVPDVLDAAFSARLEAESERLSDSIDQEWLAESAVLGWSGWSAAGASDEGELFGELGSVAGG